MQLGNSKCNLIIIANTNVMDVLLIVRYYMTSFKYNMARGLFYLSPCYNLNVKF